MAFGASGSTSSRGESITHITGVRMRVTGTGNLDMELKSQDEIITQVLPPFAMANLTNRQPFRLANFQQQRAMLEISTDEINELFKINRIILFGGYLWNEYPSDNE